MSSDFRILSLNRGIEQIFYTDDLDADRLPPESPPLLPSEDNTAHQLDSVIRPPSLELNLLSSLKPEIQDKNIMVPMHYHALLSEVHDALRTAADQVPPEKRQTIEGALKVLDENRDLMQLLNLYRNMLLKG